MNRKIVNGQLPDPDLISTLKIGKDKKKLISKILGSPSFQGEFGDNSYYYVSSVTDQIAFLDPELLDQKIIHLKFNKLDILENVYFYQSNDAKEVSMSDNSTKTTGRKVGFFEQLISNFGLPGTKGPIIGSGRTGE